MEKSYLSYSHVDVIDAVAVYAWEQALALLVSKLSSQVDRALCSPVYQASVLVASVDLL